MVRTQPLDSPVHNDLQMVAMLACELHDGPCQRLSAAFHHLEASRRLQSANPVAADAEFDRGMARLQGGMQELRLLLRGLRPLHVEHRSLVAAIEELIQEQAAEHGLQVTFSHAPDDLALPLPLQTAVFRIVQEGLTNVHRHSRSTTARVAITRTTDLVRVEIEDKGCGFDPAAAPGDCFGLVAMRARAAMLQGAARITSHPGEGTLVVAEIPIS